MTYSLEPIELTKEIILSKISEEQIFEHYGVPIKKGLFCSKLRSDKNPTVSLYRNDRGRLIMKDFGSTFCSDCFGYVQELFQVSYYAALQIIANDFNLINRPKLKKHKQQLEYSGNTIDHTEQAQIRVEIRDWEQTDLDWWGSYGITLDTLKKFKVYPCKTVWLNENIIYINNNRQRAYGYFGGIKNGIELWRIYFPGRHRWKFINNWKRLQIQGAHMIPKSNDYIVITKALKDVMTLYEYGIPAIAPCSENVFLTDNQYNRLKTQFKHIVLFYDNDYAGICYMNKIRKKFPDLDIIYLPRCGGDKDISDYRKAHGHKKTLELLEYAKAYYEKKWQ